MHRMPGPFSRILLFCSCLLLIGLLGSGLSYAWFYFHPASKPRLQQLSPASVFKPVVGDTYDPQDNDPDITVEQALIPGFQFRQGGYSLSGRVTDAKTGQPVVNAVIWINLPVRKDQPTSAALHSVADASGNFQFVHLASGSYTVVASRYNNIGDGRFYAERIFPSISLQSNRSHLVLPLSAILVPGKRAVIARSPKNLILIDLRSFYAASLLDDPLLVNSTRNLRAFLSHADVLQSVWSPYGWRPLDQYVLLTGTYPQWATFDPWPQTVSWGMPDGVDTTFWFTGGRNAHLFGQESIFDVAKSYGMQTSVVVGADYILSDATTRNLDLLQRYSAFSADNWLTQMKSAISSGAQEANGLLLYGELAPLAAADASSSPDAQGDAYQQGLELADQTFGQLLTWLAQQGLLQNTLIALTTSQAQANHTDADNFYGMGITGQGTSKQALLALAGPSMCTTVTDTPYSSFIITPLLTQALGLPVPMEARIPSTFQRKSC